MTSPRDEKSAIGNFTELSETDCKELLAQHTAGRIGFMAGDGPQILPVTYQYRNGSVIFRTSPAGPLAALVRRTIVAFEIDGIDEQNKSGWSVLVNGFAEAMAHDYLLTTAWETGLCPGRTACETCSSRSNRARSAAGRYGVPLAADDDQGRRIDTMNWLLVQYALIFNPTWAKLAPFVHDGRA